MKPTVHKLRRALLVAVALCATATATAQNKIYDIGGLSTKTSIIREYLPDKYVLYNRGNGSQFIYANTQAMTGTEMDVSAIVTDVTDMCIKDKYLFFCGTRGSQVLMGYFFIPDLIAGTATVETFDITTHVTSGTGYTETITQLLKIDAYYASPTDFHMFAIGHATAVDQYGNQLPPYRCIIDAYYDGYTLQYFAHAEASGVYYFNDLAVTGSSLVVVGDKHGGEAQYMHEYTIPSSGNTLYPNTPYYYMTSAQLYYPLSEIKIIGLSNNAFATACYAFCDVDTLITVTTYSSIGNIADRVYFPNSKPEKKVIDMAYNKHTHTIGFITNQNSAYMYHLQLSTGTLSFNNCFSMKAAPYPFRSCTHLTTDKEFMVSCSGTGQLLVWNSQLISDGCADVINKSFVHSNHQEMNAKLNLSLDVFKYTFSPYQPQIIPITLNIYCE